MTDEERIEALTAIEVRIRAAAEQWFNLAPDHFVNDGSAQCLADIFYGALGEEEEWRATPDYKLLMSGAAPMGHPMSPGPDYNWDQPFWDRLWQGFFVLRDQHGYFLVDDTQCCRTCSWAMVPDERADKALFYHHQDRNGFKGSGYVYLYWDGDPALIKSVLEAQGLVVEHDGSKEARIKVFPAVEADNA